MRALHALLAAAVVVALVAAPLGAATTVGPSAAVDDGPAGTPAPQVTTPSPPQVGEPRSPAPSGTVEVLALSEDAPNRSTTRSVVIDVGPAVSLDANASSHELLTLRAVTRLREADDPDAAVDEELTRLEGRADALGRSQRSTLRAFVDGRIDGRTALFRLARIDRAARALDDRRSRVLAAARDRDASVQTERSAALARELDIYTGPVRSRVAGALAGGTSTARVHLSATPRGVTLAALTESGYVRETYRGELRRTGGEPPDEGAARAAVADAYPSVWSAREVVDVVPARVSRVTVTYDGGELAATLGAGNGRVFRDVHRQSLGVAGTDETAVNTRDGLRMVVNRSYAGGPMRIRMSEADGGPVNASLTVGPEGGNSVPVGSTGADGERWVITPDERFTIVGIRGQSVVFITMDPLGTPRTADR